MAKGSGKGSQQVTRYDSSQKATAVAKLSKTSYKSGSSTAYQKTTRVNHQDKQTGCYGRYTQKEKASSGELHVEKGTGQVGVKNEFTKSSTVRVGNKSGYTEYQTEERIRDVKFDTSSSGGYGSNKYQSLPEKEYNHVPGAHYSGLIFYSGNYSDDNGY